MSEDNLLDVELNNALVEAAEAMELFADFTAEFVMGDEGHSVADMDSAYRDLKESLKIARKKGVDYKSKLSYNT